MILRKSVDTCEWYKLQKYMHTSIDRERAGADLKPTLTYNYNYLSTTYNQGQLYPYMDYTFYLIF